jgi:hypothetical protein
MTTEQRELIRKERLDHTTAEGRAMRAAYRRDMEAQRKAMGLPPMGGMGGGPRGGAPGGFPGGAR